MTANDLVRILRTVPEKKLKIIELAWELVDVEGEGLDLDKCIQRTAEIRLADQESQAYISGMSSVLWRLRRLTDNHH